MTSITNFEKIGLLYDDLIQGLDADELPNLTRSEVMGVTKPYQILTGTNGESVWFAEDENGALLTANPMFARGGSMTVKLDRIIEGQEPYAFSECDCLFSVLENGERITRMQVLMVNLASHSLEKTNGLFGQSKQQSKLFKEFDGKILKIQLAVFANQIQTHATEADFAAAQEADFALSSTSFIPSGLFVEGDTPSAPVGFGSGSVKDCGTSRSCFGGPDYNWAVVDCVGGDYAVVWSPLQGAATQTDAILQFDGMLIAQWNRVLDSDT